MAKILAIQGSDLKKVNIKTDTTILLASEAQKRGYKIYYFEPENLSFLNGKILAFCKHIKINENKKKYYSLLRNVKFLLATYCLRFNPNSGINEVIQNVYYKIYHYKYKCNKN